VTFCCNSFSWKRDAIFLLLAILSVLEVNHHDGIFILNIGKHGTKGIHASVLGGKAHGCGLIFEITEGENETVRLG
jgi:hypothetical protein